VSALASDLASRESHFPLSLPFLYIYIHRLPEIGFYYRQTSGIWRIEKKRGLRAAMNGDARNERAHIDADVDAASLGADILNPFVHRLELGSTYDKLKVSTSRKRLPPRGSMLVRARFRGCRHRRASIAVPRKCA